MVNLYSRGRACPLLRNNRIQCISCPYSGANYPNTSRRRQGHFFEFSGWILYPPDFYQVCISTTYGPSGWAVSWYALSPLFVEEALFVGRRGMTARSPRAQLSGALGAHNNT